MHTVLCLEKHFQKGIDDVNVVKIDVYHDPLKMMPQTPIKSTEIKGDRKGSEENTLLLGAQEVLFGGFMLFCILLNCINNPYRAVT